jgi:hypothetical protein
MLSNSHLYSIWRKELAQLVGDKYQKYRLTNLVLLVVGIFQARSVHLSVIARKIPIRAQKLSLMKRLERFLANPVFRVRAWYRPVAERLVQAAGSAGQIHLGLDATKVSAHHRLLMVAIAYRGRTLPLAWTWVRSSKGHSTATKQLALLRYVRTLIPASMKVSVVGDSEFASTRLMRQFDEWSWDYALRQRGRVCFTPYCQLTALRFDQVVIEPGDKLWFGSADFGKTRAYVTNVVLVWLRGEPEPWYLATNLPSPHGAITLYRRRMWIEEMFGDMKRHGFDLEVTQLVHIQRLSRLTMAVCLVFLWLIATGEHVLHAGLAAEVDRRDRRDLSLFRLGWDWLERRLCFNDPFPALFIPAFLKVSGG